MNLGDIRTRVWERLGEDASNPLRYSQAMVDGFVNDAIQLMAMATGHNVATVTINQRDETLSYKLPADHIRTLGVTWGAEKRPLEPVTWSDMDQFSYAARLEHINLRNRWLRTTGARSTHYIPFSHDEVWLWPINPDGGELSRSSSHTIMDETFTADGAKTVFTLANSPTQYGVWVAGIRLTAVPSPTQAWEYNITGNTLTFGVAPVTGQRVQATYITGGAEMIIGENIMTSSLANTPSAGSEVAIYAGGVRLKYNPSGPTGMSPGEVHVTDAGIITFAMTPPGGTQIYADYPLLADTAHTWQSYPTGLNSKEFVITGTPPLEEDVVVHRGGVRLARTTGVPGVDEFSISGNVIRVDVEPGPLSHVAVDYVQQSAAVQATYELTYLQDVGLNSVSAANDTPPVPTETHEALVDYTVGRCLLLNARGDRAKLAQQRIVMFSKAISDLRRRTAGGGLMARTTVPMT